MSPGVIILLITHKVDQQNSIFSLQETDRISVLRDQKYSLNAQSFHFALKDSVIIPLQADEAVKY